MVNVTAPPRERVEARSFSHVVVPMSAKPAYMLDANGSLEPDSVEGHEPKTAVHTGTSRDSRTRFTLFALSLLGKVGGV
jgi:hypothetical protein